MMQLYNTGISPELTLDQALKLLPAGDLKRVVTTSEGYFFALINHDLWFFAQEVTTGEGETTPQWVGVTSQGKITGTVGTESGFIGGVFGGFAYLLYNNLDGQLYALDRLGSVYVTKKAQSATLYWKILPSYSGVSPVFVSIWQGLYNLMGIADDNKIYTYRLGQGWIQTGMFP